MITNPLVLSALLYSSQVSAVSYPEKDGHCPFQAGEIKSNVKDTLNAHRLAGLWINMFDRAHLNEEYKCYGVKLMHTHPYDDLNSDLANEEHMKDTPKVFEYMKATNVGESSDPNDPVEVSENDYDDMLAFGYHIHHGLQLNFDHKSDKSIAYLKHRDTQLDTLSDEDVREHTHDTKESYFNEHAFDSQFKRYAQVLDTDYDNYMVLYQCKETAQYFDKESGKRIPAFEAWHSATSSSLNFSSWPQTEYKFGENVAVQPRHFENVKILWRPRKHVQEYDEEYFEGLNAEEIAEMKANQQSEWRFPLKGDIGNIDEVLDKQKKMIKSVHPTIDFGEYETMDHQDGKCDYDPYDRYDAHWNDEISSFGHLYSEDIEQAPQEGDEPAYVEEGEQADGYEYDPDTNEESPYYNDDEQDHDNEGQEDDMFSGDYSNYEDQTEYNEDGYENEGGDGGDEREPYESNFEADPYESEYQPDDNKDFESEEF